MSDGPALKPAKTQPTRMSAGVVVVRVVDRKLPQPADNDIP